MKPSTLGRKFTGWTGVLMVGIFLLLGTTAAWLISRPSPQGGLGFGFGSQSHHSVFPINVLLYPQPVEVTSWTPDPAQTTNPRGAALNVVAAMQRGEIEVWLNCWAPDERPQLTAQERQNLLAKWASLKDGRIRVLGHVVAAGDIIEEISVQGQKQESLQIPLKHQNDRWWLTKLESDDEYMQWRTSPKKLIEKLDAAAFRHYLNDVQTQTK